MGKPKAKPTLPLVVVVIREAPPTPGQVAAWRHLWQKLLETKAPGQAPQPARGGEDRKNNEAEPSKSE
jgi:hypothetical protein